ncbi:hypothetical protein QPX96_00010 [Limosilactobacillus fermentum]|nr:hypothetical protein [Limosilactobacillus fermentum]
MILIIANQNSASPKSLAAIKLTLVNTAKNTQQAKKKKPINKPKKVSRWKPKYREINIAHKTPKHHKEKEQS